MAKRTSTTYLTPGEQVAGAVLFVIYLLVLPFATGPLFRLVEALLGTQLSPALENILYYYILFAVTVIVFHGFLGRTTRVLVDRAGSAGKVLLAGLVALYGLNELVYRLTRLVVDNRTNLNDVSISAQIDDAPRVTMLIVIFLAPFVEEVLFRGLVFGGLRGKSVLLAMPAALGVVLHLMGTDPLVLGVAVAQMAMPVAVNGTMLCLEFDGDVEAMAQVTFMTTVLSIVTSPLAVSLFV